MKRIRTLAICTTTAAMAVLVGQMGALADRPGNALDSGTFTPAGSGPDVIVGSIPSIHKWGGSSGIGAYSIGTTSCNIGDQVLQWQSNNNLHPVISQHMYRLKDGRFEQIGQSWLKHGFCALSGTLCGPCQATGCSNLGIGCSDPYTDTRNGSQGNLGPKSEVNASNGVFQYPYSNSSGSGTIFKRLQVDNDDLDPSLNAGALYFVESQYVTQDDAQAGNGNNNSSYRRMTVGSFSSGAYNVSLTGATAQQKTPLQAWQDFQGGVTIQNVDVPGDGRFQVGYAVTNNGDGTWHYEYAVYNMTSHRSARSFTVPVAAGVNVTNIDFHDVPYHSGDGENVGTNFDGTDWAVQTGGGAITWSTSTFNQNDNANAIRWGTTYNFRFDADAPPSAAAGSVGLYRNGGSAGVNFLAPGEGGGGNGGEADLVNFSVLVGNQEAGNLDSLIDSDDDEVVVSSVTQGVRNNALIEATLLTDAITVSDLVVTVEVGPPSVSPVFLTVQLYNYSTGFFEGQTFSILSTTSDTVKVISPLNPGNYVGIDGTIRVRVGQTAREPQTPNGFDQRVDQISADVTP